MKKIDANGKKVEVIQLDRAAIEAHNRVMWASGEPILLIGSSVADGEELFAKVTTYDSVPLKLKKTVP